MPEAGNSTLPSARKTLQELRESYRKNTRIEQGIMVSYYALSGLYGDFAYYDVGHLRAVEIGMAAAWFLAGRAAHTRAKVSSITERRLEAVALAYNLDLQEPMEPTPTPLFDYLDPQNEN